MKAKQKKVITCFLAICFLLQSCPLNFFISAKTPSNAIEQTNSVGELGGYLAGNAKVVNQLFVDRKIEQGHGFAAEIGNNLIDTLKGLDATIVGNDNKPNGADRKIINRDGSVTWIQDKYYSTARQSVNAAFDDTNGLYRYIDADGNPMKLEIPSDQYDEAIDLLKTKIKEGKLSNCNITDPDEATNIIKKGGLSYKQAVNLAKAGTLDSLKYDAVNGTVSATYAAGISFVIDYACCLLNGIEPDVALKNAGMNGLKAGGVVFATHVISSQLVKAGVSNALVPTSEAIAKALGDDICEAILLSNGVSAAGKDVVKNAAKIIAKEMVVDGVLIVVLTGVDVVELFRGRISKEELLKNLTVTIIGVAGGAAGGYGGAALGSLIAPGAGTAIGAILGSVASGTLTSYAAELLIAPFYESDAEEMFKIINDEFVILSQEYLINENEGITITDKLKSKLAGDTLKDVYASKNRNKMARELMEPLFIEQAETRKQITMPTEDELRSEMKTALNGIVFIH